MINFANVKEWKIPYNGSLADVIRVTDTNNTRVIWEKPSKDKDWFFIENTTNSTITPTLKRGGSGNQNEVPILTIETSTDKETWTSAGTTSTSTPITFTIPANSKLYIRCNTTAWGGTYYSSSSGNYETDGNYFNGCPKVGGNILSLMYGSSFTGNENLLRDNYSFPLLFNRDTTLVDASELILPTDVSKDCYLGMFNRCTSLVNAPALPATNFNVVHNPYASATQCYYGMFYGCTSLTTAPELPCSDILINGATYAMMFRNCSSLNYIKCLATSNQQTSSTNMWVSGVAATGTFVKSSGTSWNTGDSGIPSGWTVVEV